MNFSKRFKQSLTIGALLLTAPIAHAFSNAEGTSTTPVSEGQSNSKKTDDFGLGLQVGDFNALTFNYWVTESRSWEAISALGNEFSAFGISQY